MAQADPTRPSFASVPMGLPGLETRLPLLFSAGVLADRIDLCTFARVTATNPAKLYGLYPRKGAIRTGADADLALFDPDAPGWTMAHGALHDVLDYTPYEGLPMQGRLRYTVLRGEVVYEHHGGDTSTMAGMDGGQVRARPGMGHWIATGRPDLLGCAWEGSFPDPRDVVLTRAGRL
jgi:dihydroorotase-like cyclic amidohydrolase